MTTSTETEAPHEKRLLGITTLADELRRAAAALERQAFRIIELDVDLAAAQEDLAKLRAGVDQLRVSAMNADWHTFDQVCKEMKGDA